MANASLEDPNTCLLRYLMSTEPTPVQTGGDLRLDTSVSTPANATVYCNKIVLAFPVDSSDPAALYASAPITSLNTSNWAVTSAVQTGEELGMGIFDIEYTTFIYTCSVPEYYQINYNLVFGAFGPVSPATGSTKVFVKETSGTTSDPGTFTDKTCSLDIEKQPPQLYLVNFIATNPNAPTVPISDFANAAPIYFEWESNGTYFRIFAGGQHVYSGAETNFTLSAGIVRDTSFILVAMMTGDPSGDSPSGAYLPVYLYEALTVTVSNPDLTPKSVAAGALAVTGNTSLGGTLEVGGAASVNGMLGVAGPITAIAGVNVTGSPLSATAGASLTGGLSTDSLTVSQSINAGSVSAVSVSASGGADCAVAANIVGAAERPSPALYAGNTGFGPALMANNKSIWGSIMTVNETSDANHTTGIYAWVATPSDWGLATNGRISTSSGDSVLTHVPTRNGHRVVTSPVALESELHASGEGRLEQGLARIGFPPDLADAIHHSAAYSYRVQLTPTGQCKGLAVVEKTPEGFRVEELGKGTSEAGFDWFLVARRPHAPGSNDLRALPGALAVPLPTAPPE